MKKLLFAFTLLLFSFPSISQELFVTVTPSRTVTAQNFLDGVYTNGNTVTFSGIDAANPVYFSIARHVRHDAVISVIASCFEELRSFYQRGVITINGELYAFYTTKHPRDASSLNGIPYTIK